MDIKIGDKVRSYDFDGRKDCYIEGVVCAFEKRDGCDRYVVTVVNTVFAGKADYASASGRLAYPPVNGTPKLFGGACNGVEKIADFGE